MYVYDATATKTGCSLLLFRCEIHSNTANYVRNCPAPFHGPNGCPMEDISRRCPSRSQGGGVYVYYGTATLTTCQVYNNAVLYVSLCPHPIPWPPWKMFFGTGPIPCDAMPRLPTRRPAAGGMLPPVMPHSMAPMEDVSRKCLSRVRREAAWLSTMARPP